MQEGSVVIQQIAAEAIVALSEYQEALTTLRDKQYRKDQFRKILSVLQSIYGVSQLCDAPGLGEVSDLARQFAGQIYSGELPVSEADISLLSSAGFALKELIPSVDGSVTKSLADFSNVTTELRKRILSAQSSISEREK